MSLKGKTALVIGGARGIGLATAKKFLREGAQVTVCDVSVWGETVVKELQADFGPKSSIFVKADVRDDAQLEAAFTTTKNHFKRLDIVVNSAAILNDFDWNTEVDINLKGIIRGTLLAWKHMGKQNGGDGGTVINFSCISSLMSVYVVPIFSATSSSVVVFTRCSGESHNFDRTGVRVLPICPGHTKTQFHDKMKALTEDLTEQSEELLAMFPLQMAANVAKGVLQLIHNAKSGSVWVCEENKPV